MLFPNNACSIPKYLSDFLCEGRAAESLPYPLSVFSQWSRTSLCLCLSEKEKKMTRSICLSRDMTSPHLKLFEVSKQPCFREDIPLLFLFYLIF